MHRLRWSAWIMMAALVAGAGAQTTSPVPTQPASQTSTTAASRAAARRRAAAARRRKAAEASQTNHADPVQSVPMETAAPSPPTSPAVEAKQKAADQKLLQQQQAQSAQAAAITDQQVEAAQRQKDAIQNEVRIQDAPGPAQTGVVPAAGVPVAPVNANDRIQDAPGPAQTLPPLPKTVPSPQDQTPTQTAPATTPPPQ